MDDDVPANRNTLERNLTYWKILCSTIVGLLIFIIIVLAVAVAQHSSSSREKRSLAAHQHHLVPLVEEASGFHVDAVYSMQLNSHEPQDDRSVAAPHIDPWTEFVYSDNDAMDAAAAYWMSFTCPDHIQKVRMRAAASNVTHQPLALMAVEQQPIDMQKLKLSLRSEIIFGGFISGTQFRLLNGNAHDLMLVIRMHFGDPDVRAPPRHEVYINANVYSAQHHDLTVLFAHALGHALGLPHSNEGHLMNHRYSGAHDRADIEEHAFCKHAFAAQ